MLKPEKKDEQMSIDDLMADKAV
jgi:hypothetical protein